MYMPTIIPVYCTYVRLCLEESIIKHSSNTTTMHLELHDWAPWTLQLLCLTILQRSNQQSGLQCRALQRQWQDLEKVCILQGRVWETIAYGRQSCPWQIDKEIMEETLAGRADRLDEMIVWSLGQCEPVMSQDSSNKINSKTRTDDHNQYIRLHLGFLVRHSLATLFNGCTSIDIKMGHISTLQGSYSNFMTFQLSVDKD